MTDIQLRTKPEDAPDEDMTTTTKRVTKDA